MLVRNFYKILAGLVLFISASVSFAQTPLTGTFTSAGQTVSSGSIGLVLQNCGVLPTAGSSSYNFGLTTGGVLSGASAQGNAGNGCTVPTGGSGNASYYEVTLRDHSSNLVWRRYYIIPVSGSAFNLSTATPLAPLPAAVAVSGPAGANGAAGAPGATGSPATVAVGTVTAAAPGTTPIVHNSGTASNAVLDFTIPSVPGNVCTATNGLCSGTGNGTVTTGTQYKLPIYPTGGGTVVAPSNISTDSTYSDVLGVRNLTANNTNGTIHALFYDSSHVGCPLINGRYQCGDGIRLAEEGMNPYDSLVIENTFASAAALAGGVAGTTGDSQFQVSGRSDQIMVDDRRFGNHNESFHNMYNNNGGWNGPSFACYTDKYPGDLGGTNSVGGGCFNLSDESLTDGFSYGNSGDHRYNQGWGGRSLLTGNATYHASGINTIAGFSGAKFALGDFQGLNLQMTSMWGSTAPSDQGLNPIEIQVYQGNSFQATVATVTKNSDGQNVITTSFAGGSLGEGQAMLVTSKVHHYKQNISYNANGPATVNVTNTDGSPVTLPASVCATLASDVTPYRLDPNEYSSINTISITAPVNGLSTLTIFLTGPSAGPIYFPGTLIQLSGFTGDFAYLNGQQFTTTASGAGGAGYGNAFYSMTVPYTGTAIGTTGTGSSTVGNLAVNAREDEVLPGRIPGNGTVSMTMKLNPTADPYAGSFNTTQPVFIEDIYPELVVPTAVNAFVGTGAVATATATSGSVSSVTATATGSGYTSGHVNVTLVTRILTTSVDASSGGNAVYHGSFPTNYTYVGKTISIIGFNNASNMGTFTVVSSTSSTLTVNNPSAIAETTTFATGYVILTNGSGLILAPTVTSGGVSSYAVVTGGTGYDNPPLIVITGDIDMTLPLRNEHAPGDYVCQGGYAGYAAVMDDYHFDGEVGYASYITASTATTMRETFVSGGLNGMTGQTYTGPVSVYPRADVISALNTTTNLADGYQFIVSGSDQIATNDTLVGPPNIAGGISGIFHGNVSSSTPFGQWQGVAIGMPGGSAVSPYNAGVEIDIQGMQMPQHGHPGTGLNNECEPGGTCGTLIAPNFVWSRSGEFSSGISLGSPPVGNVPRDSNGNVLSDPNYLKQGVLLWIRGSFPSTAVNTGYYVFRDDGNGVGISVENHSNTFNFGNAIIGAGGKTGASGTGPYSFNVGVLGDTTTRSLTVGSPSGTYAAVSGAISLTSATDNSVGALIDLNTNAGKLGINGTKGLVLTSSNGSTAETVFQITPGTGGVHPLINLAANGSTVDMGNNGTSGSYFYNYHQSSVYHGIHGHQVGSNWEEDIFANQGGALALGFMGADGVTFAPEITVSSAFNSGTTFVHNINVPNISVNTGTPWARTTVVGAVDMNNGLINSAPFRFQWGTNKNFAIDVANTNAGGTLPGCGYSGSSPLLRFQLNDGETTSATLAAIDTTGSLCGLHTVRVSNGFTAYASNSTGTSSSFYISGADGGDASGHTAWHISSADGSAYFAASASWPSGPAFSISASGFVNARGIVFANPGSGGYAAVDTDGTATFDNSAITFGDVNNGGSGNGIASFAQNNFSIGADGRLSNDNSNNPSWDINADGSVDFGFYNASIDSIGEGVFVGSIFLGNTGASGFPVMLFNDGSAAFAEGNMTIGIDGHIWFDAGQIFSDGSGNLNVGNSLTALCVIGQYFNDCGSGDVGVVVQRMTLSSSGSIVAGTDIFSKDGLDIEMAHSTTGVKIFSGIDVVESPDSTHNYNSPYLAIGGSYLDSSSLPQQNTWHIQDVMGTGSTPTSILDITQSGSSGFAAVRLANLMATGVLQMQSTAPTGTCSVAGAWVFSQDGHGTYCPSVGGTWATKI